MSRAHSHPPSRHSAAAPGRLETRLVSRSRNVPGRRTIQGHSGTRARVPGEEIHNLATRGHSGLRALPLRTGVRFPPLALGAYSGRSAEAEYVKFGRLVGAMPEYFLTAALSAPYTGLRREIRHGKQGTAVVFHAGQRGSWKGIINP